MDNFALARAESRISNLESEITALRSDIEPRAREDEWRRAQQDWNTSYWLFIGALCVFTIIIMISGSAKPT